jgi:hypothetical protein
MCIMKDKDKKIEAHLFRAIELIDQAREEIRKALELEPDRDADIIHRAETYIGDACGALCLIKMPPTKKCLRTGATLYWSERLCKYVSIPENRERA